MNEQELVYLLLIVTIVIMVILLPPGPGSPLRDWARSPEEAPVRR